MPSPVKTTPVFDLVFSRDGRTAETGIKANCRFYEACGLIEQCDIDEIPLRDHVSYPRTGGGWGSGEYVRGLVGERYGKVYRLAEGYNHGHLELANRQRHERERQMTLADINARVDAVLAGRDPVSS